MNKIVIASKNKGKIAEFELFFKAFNISVQSLLDFPEIEEVEETGHTFVENAKLKSETIAQKLKCLVLADDSGLSVNALDGAPGVYSARYAGQPQDSEKNIDKLLKEMEDKRDRSAYFTSCLTLSYPNYPSLVIEGKVNGVLLKERDGQGGFGYDPIFFYEPDQATFAQISKERKNQISHRAIALQELMQVLPDWLKELKAHEATNNE